MPASPTEWADFRRQMDEAVSVAFALVAESTARATSALLDNDMGRARQVINEDRQVDDHCDALTGLIREGLADIADRPAELEELVAVLQMVPELERSADLAAHIARRTLDGLGDAITPRSRGLIQAMNDTAVRMWRAAADGYRERSRDVGFDLAAADDELDGLAAGLVEEVLGAGAEPRVAAEVALLARFYERSGDHAVNLARRVDAMVAPRRITSARLLARRPRPAAEDARGLRRLLGPLRRLRIVPTDEVFFELFQAAADNARDCAEELRKMVASFEAIDVHFQNVKRYERRGDQITRDLLHKLDSSFVTPYDREDIHALAEKIDDVVDDVFAVAELIELVQVDRALPEFPELADVLVAMAAEMVELIGCLRSKTGARYRLERIEAFEREGDAVYRRLMARLFTGEYEALDVLRWKDIVQALEDSLNAIEDVSDVVESILVKSS
jgi:uncharacterized protein